MEIIAHRGFWRKKTDQNTISAFKLALNNYYGIETDIRDQNGHLVVSHDIPKKKSTRLSELFRIYSLNSSDRTLALNIKADGLQKELLKLLKKYDIKNYFVFDMSIPESIKYSKTPLNIYMRLSEYEKNYKNFVFKGLWIDQFNSDWISPMQIKIYLKSKINICLVSSELHQRDQEQLWKMIFRNNIYKYKNFSLCTDFPSEARKFFDA